MRKISREDNALKFKTSPNKLIFDILYWSLFRILETNEYLKLIDNSVKNMTGFAKSPHEEYFVVQQKNIYSVVIQSLEKHLPTVEGETFMNVDEVDVQSAITDAIGKTRE